MVRRERRLNEVTAARRVLVGARDALACCFGLRARARMSKVAPMTRRLEEAGQTQRDSATHLALPAVRVGFETARLKLAQIRQEGAEARVSAYRIACRQSAQTLGVARVSIWMLSDDTAALARELRCVLLYDVRTDAYSSGGCLVREQCPAYFDAVQNRRVLVVEDAHRAPETAGLAQYLREANIGALLDAPVYRDGRVVGVVCHEHVGGARHWSEKEAGFATAVADMLTILSHQAEQAELRAAIDAQKQIEAQHHKMQALMKLGRVVIHDLGNVLTVATLRAGMLASEKDLPTASDEIGRVLGYGSTLLSQLRDFCEDRPPNSVIDAAAVLAPMQSVLSALLGGTNISLEFSCKTEPLELNMSKVELEQLVLNLCMNAKDAISGSGHIRVVAAQAGGHLELTVEDSGRGMDESTQGRLFEPFFTTKQGHSGIGLAAVYGIVERARGKIDVSSTVGAGTTFRVQLPLRPGPPDTSFDQPWAF